MSAAPTFTASLLKSSLSVQPYLLSSFSLLPTLLYINKILILLATFPTKLNDHYSLLSSAVMAFIGSAHAGGILVNIILGESISLSNKILFIYSALWILFSFSTLFRTLIVEGLYGKRSYTIVRFLLLLFNQYNRAVAVLQFEAGLEMYRVKGTPVIHGMDNLIGIALLSALASNTGTLVSSTLRPHLYKSYQAKPTDFFSVWWVFGLMVWYGLCRIWNDGTTFVTIFALAVERAGLSSVAIALRALPWTAVDDVVFGYLIYPFVELLRAFMKRNSATVSIQKGVVRVKGNKVKKG